MKKRISVKRKADDLAKSKVLIEVLIMKTNYENKLSHKYPLVDFETAEKRYNLDSCIWRKLFFLIADQFTLEQIHDQKY